MTRVAQHGLPCVALASLRWPALLVLLLLVLIAPAVRGQDYVPSPPALTAASCGPQQRFVTIGTVDSTNSTRFPANAQGTQLGQRSRTHAHARALACRSAAVPPRPHRCRC